MSRFTVDDKDTHGQEGHQDHLGCSKVQRAFDHRVRRRFLHGDCVL